jgi:16S rRNA (adenine1518-N6/adenine1519-N6)-dimethyltransferase
VSEQLKVEAHDQAPPSVGEDASLPDTHTEDDLPTSLSGWQRLLDRLDIRPSKALGQNFLFERGVAQRLVRQADIGPDDLAVEVGPGLGILTRELLAAAGHVIAIEYDPRLAQDIRDTFGDQPNFTLAEADVLQVTMDDLAPPSSPYIVAANLRYGIAAAVIQHFFAQRHRPIRIVVMVQREVAERLVAPPGELSVLGVAVQFYSEPRILFDVPPTVFIPPPTVLSSVVRLDVRPELPLPDDQHATFFKIVRAGFSQKRKQVANSIAARLGLSKTEVEAWLRRAGVDPDRRAQTLSVDEWVAMTKAAPPLPEGDTSTTRRRDRVSRRS